VPGFVSPICGDCQHKTLISSHGPLSNLGRGPEGGFSEPIRGTLVVRAVLAVDEQADGLRGGRRQFCFPAK
jgi:hypothetical protein